MDSVACYAWIHRLCSPARDFQVVFVEKESTGILSSAFVFSRFGALKRIMEGLLC